jgi:carbon monoxide dehydrogenase subunit G
MDFTGEHEFAAPVDTVWSMFQNPESHLAKFEDMGHRDIELVEAAASDDAFHIVVRRVVEVDLPGFAKRVLKPTNTVTTTDDWRRSADGTCTGEQKVETEGAPVKINATTRLDPVGERTRYSVTVHLEVKVPLIGGKLADWAKGRVQEQLDDEFAAGDRWLASS